MALTLQMIGTGSAFAKKYFNNNALLRAGAFTLLIDCGITAPMALHQLNVDVADIDALLITHLHADHAGGLEELAFRMRFVHRRRPLLYIAEPLAEPLWENCLKAGMEDEEYRSLDQYFQVVTMREGEPCRIVDGLEIELMRTDHVPGKLSYGLLINRSVYYSGDSLLNRERLESLVHHRGVRLIFHDCQLQGPPSVHATLDQLLALPEHLQSRIFLMHYGDDKDQYVGRTGRMSFVEQHRLYTLEP
jgi:ribonuclease BN (tRNA processing enzyme)